MDRFHFIMKYRTKRFWFSDFKVAVWAEDTKEAQSRLRLSYPRNKWNIEFQTSDKMEKFFKTGFC